MSSLLWQCGALLTDDGSGFPVTQYLTIFVMIITIANYFPRTNEVIASLIMMMIVLLWVVHGWHLCSVVMVMLRSVPWTWRKMRAECFLSIMYNWFRLIMWRNRSEKSNRRTGSAARFLFLLCCTPPPPFATYLDSVYCCWQHVLAKAGHRLQLVVGQEQRCPRHWRGTMGLKLLT